MEAETQWQFGCLHRDSESIEMVLPRRPIFRREKKIIGCFACRHLEKESHPFIRQIDETRSMCFRRTHIDTEPVSSYVARTHPEQFDRAASRVKGTFNEI